MEVEISFWTWVKMWFAEQFAYVIFFVGLMALFAAFAGLQWVFKKIGGKE